MQAKQRDAAPKSRLVVNANIQNLARVVGIVLIAGFLLWAPVVYGARIACAGSALLFSCLLIAASVSDIKKRIIPNRICLGIVTVGVFTFSPIKLLGILPALLLLLCALIFKDKIGGGDIKLTASCGFALGLPTVSAGLIIGMTVVVLYYLPLHFIRKLKIDKGQPVNQTALPLVPFLTIGFIAALTIEIIGGIIQ